MSAKEPSNKFHSFSFIIVYVLLIMALLGANLWYTWKFTESTQEITEKYYNENIYALVNHLDLDNAKILEFYKKQEENYGKFSAQYYSNQSDWLNRWLTVLVAVLTFTGVVLPLLFTRYNIEKKNDLEKLTAEMRHTQKEMAQTQKEIDDTHRQMRTSLDTLDKNNTEMKNSVQEVDEHKKKIEDDIKAQQEQMKEEIKEVKEYVAQAKEAERKAKISELINTAYLQFTEKKYDDAIKTSKQVLDLEIDNETALFYLGVCYAQKKDYNKSIRYYNEALKLTPNNVSILFNLGLCYFFKKDYDKSIEYYNKALEIKPNETKTLSILASCYLKKNDYNKAIEYYNKALEIKPNEADNISNLGVCYFKKNDYDNAINYFFKSLSIKKSALTLYNIVETYFSQRDFKNTLNYLKEFLTVDNFIFKDDKEKWLEVINHNPEKEYAQELASIIENELVEKEQDED